MMKLSEAWGEPKNLFKGEDDRFKIEEGEGQEEPNWSILYLPSFQNGGLYVERSRAHIEKQLSCRQAG